MEARKARILLVDDEIDLLRISSADLAEEGYTVSCAEDGMEALKKLEESEYDILIADLVMPGMDGMELMNQVKEKYPDMDAIILTGHGTIESAVEAMKKGAHSYLLKPFNPDEVLMEIQKIEAFQRLRLENRYLKDELLQRHRFGRIIGKDEKMMEIYWLIKEVAAVNSSVLIQGESGTGKELIAQAIHHSSPRNDRPFVRVNCAAMPEGLLESELFGHERGAFTGAIARRKGRFELADGGTLFLDEIGDMSPSLQAKLLRVLQEGEFERVGGTQTIKVDVRLISATNKDLEEEVEKGHFREDLFYRINVIPIYVPPLRERKEDIPLLAVHFLERYRTEMGKDLSYITQGALDLMRAYPWPGNVRELENVIERAVVMSHRDQLNVEDLPENLRGGSTGTTSDFMMGEATTFKEAKRRFEKFFLEEMLRRYNGNITRTAEAIQMPRRNLQMKMRMYNIEVASFG